MYVSKYVKYKPNSNTDAMAIPVVEFSREGYKIRGMLQITYSFKKSTPHCFYANWGQRPYCL